MHNSIKLTKPERSNKQNTTKPSWFGVFSGAAGSKVKGAALDWSGLSIVSFKNN